MNRRRKLRLAKHRPRLIRTLRCQLGLHNPPHDKAFTCMGAVFIGGPCTHCTDGTARELSFIGNAWDFPGVNKSAVPRRFVLSPLALAEAMQQRGLTYIGDYPA